MLLLLLFKHWGASSKRPQQATPPRSPRARSHPMPHPSKPSPWRWWTEWRIAVIVPPTPASEGRLRHTARVTPLARSPQRPPQKNLEAPLSPRSEGKRSPPLTPMFSRHPCFKCPAQAARSQGCGLPPELPTRHLWSEFQLPAGYRSSTILTSPSHSPSGLDLTRRRTSPLNSSSPCSKWTKCRLPSRNRAPGSPPTCPLPPPVPLSRSQSQSLWRWSRSLPSKTRLMPGVRRTSSTSPRLSIYRGSSLRELGVGRKNSLVQTPLMWTDSLAEVSCSE